MGAAPLIIPGIVHHAETHGIQFHIASSSKKVLFIHHAGTEAPLPQMPCPAFSPIDTACKISPGLLRENSTFEDHYFLGDYNCVQRVSNIKEKRLCTFFIIAADKINTASHMVTSFTEYKNFAASKPGLALMLCACLSAIVLNIGCSRHVEYPEARSGFMDLSKWSFGEDGNVPREGQWACHPEKILAPAPGNALGLPSSAYVSLPGRWDMGGGDRGMPPITCA